MWKKDNINLVFIIFILIIAVFLRFFHFFDLPFMWDEMSAWHRLHFPSLNELIEKGIKPDGHPAGVQVFLYHWTMLFGDKEWVVKLPFALMSVSSVYILYRIGSIWFGEKSGLFAASLLATQQFFILYGTIARPYGSGLFLTLLMALFWSKYFFRGFGIKDLVLYVLFSALAAYNHHFSLLFAAIAGLTGLFLIPREQLKYYILAGVGIFIIYIPHLPIFFAQLQIGGIGGEGNWLSKPSPDFTWQLIYWAFQYSIPVMLLSLAFLAYSVFAQRDSIEKRMVKTLVLILWFSLPLAIGLYYSIYINPVIQYSVLIFSFPYLFLLIGSRIEKMNPYMFFPTLVLIIALNIYQLIVVRQHYTIMISQPFEVTASIIHEQNDKNRQTFAIYNSIPEYQFYYCNKYRLDKSSFLSVYNQNYDFRKFDNLVSQIKENYVLSSALPPEFVAIIESHFPFLILSKNAYTSEHYLWSRIESDSSLRRKPHLVIDFDKKIKGLNAAPNRIVESQSGVKSFEFKENQEWGFTFKDSLALLGFKHGEIIDLVAQISSDTNQLNATWVCQFKADSLPEIWRGKPTQITPSGKNPIYTTFHSLDTRILIKPKDWNNYIFTTYFWNKNHDSFKIENIRIYRQPANPIRYGLFEKIDD